MAIEVVSKAASAGIDREDFVKAVADGDRYCRRRVRARCPAVCLADLHLRGSYESLVVECIA